MSATPQDHYALLGVPYAASAAAISSAYRTLALRWHPDKQADAAAAGAAGAAADRAQAHTKFLQLQQAYSVLRDQEARQQYDAALQGEQGINSGSTLKLSWRDRSSVVV
jgi:DnaJ-class molecular chaperone